MLSVKTTKKFESDLKRMLRAGYEPELFWAIVELLAEETAIPDEFRDHELEGEWAGVRDIHIEADWLLLYQVSGQDLILVRTGTHEDLF
ncbi:MAG: type II toxin-antitoxin system YafQ family toxin [Rhodothermales bacterium]